jgi:hypothetical protein
MHCRPGSHLDGLEIQLAAFAPAGEDHCEQLIHFLGDFLLDRVDRFFSAGASVSATGRDWQI